MELRVWVDGTQRVVCGVKLTTTCQEIVFALAHATQQAGRFTMIERWRNNERLLSPNEQPLVTLQRWGDRMNEVEFILRKTSTEPLTSAQQHQQHPTTNTIQAQQSVNNMPSLTQSQQLSNARTNTPAGSTISKQSNPFETDPISKQQANGSNNLDSPVPSHINPVIHQAQHQSTSQNLMSDQARDNLYQQQQRQFNLNRRPQTSLGPLTSSNSALNLTSGNHLNQLNNNRLINAYRPSLSATVLPHSSNNGSTTQSMIRSRIHDEKPRYNEVNNLQNGYQHQDETLRYHQSNAPQIIKNFPYEELYSTINKKRVVQPPAVPAKPKIVGNMQHQAQPINNSQMNYYHPGQSPVLMYPMNMRARHPPGYMEYMDAMANRNSLPSSLVNNPSFMHQNPSVQTNICPRSSYDLLEPQIYNIHQHQQPHQNGTSSANHTNGNQHYYQNNQPVNRMGVSISNDNAVTSTIQAQLNHMNPKLIESGLVINRGSAVNIKLPPNSQYMGVNNSSIEDQKLDTSIQSNTSSVSQMGMDMLKIIEEQKKVLLNQKDELKRLDHDQEVKQNSEQVELVGRIEKEIAQLETLWRENQTQIRRLENQDYEKELEFLKAEQFRMEQEIGKQKERLVQFDEDIAECKRKIEQLEKELESVGSDLEYPDEDPLDGEDNRSNGETTTCANNNLDLKPQKTITQTNGLCRPTNDRLSESSDDDDSGEASDELNNSDGSSRLRSAKDVAYVDKRGLISGLRSLKLDKTRAQNRSNERVNSTENLANKLITTSSPSTSHLIHKDKCPEEQTADGFMDYELLTGASNGVQELTSEVEANGSEDITTATISDKNLNGNNNNNNNNNSENKKYEFLMTL